MAERGKPFGSVVAGLGIGVGLAVAGWSAIGPDHPVFAVVAQAGFLLMALLVGPALVDVGRSRYRVRDTEPRLYALVGAEAVRRVLDSVGWNRIISRMRHSESGSSMVSRFLRGTEQSETAHLLGAVATALLAVLAAATGHAQGSAQLLLTGFVLHGYPVMIQRMVRFTIVSRQTRTSPKPYC
ncbi:hypothetical protein [Arthrobacter ruber]|uniref:glycosyl-4,4'-diaponeurosporenoate acyltransferase CrtO family protein n=1 Tax=Arthrobacter ruber TaxID=1258893 RepID=UPI0012FFE367|nr:hypothetical protein [Arthrobacter ruber]